MHRRSLIDLQATLRELAVGGATYRYYSLAAASQAAGLDGLARLPFSLRILAENLLRHGKDATELAGRLAALARGERGFEIPFRPARVLLQDLLGVPVMVDFAALREAVAAAGGETVHVNPARPRGFRNGPPVISGVPRTRGAHRR